MRKFPKNFLWGAATSSYQVEGSNRNCDWWQWEKRVGKPQSGNACRHYQLYEHDFDIVKSLNHNAHRFSIEWSRIEPAEGKFSKKELQHYLNVILALKKRNIEPLVTLHHFTNPIWFAKDGGWINQKSVERYLRYCDFVVRNLAKHVRYWITINEPTIFISHAYLFGAWPPQEKSLLKATYVEEHLAFAHIKAYGLIHKIYKELNLSSPQVSIAQNVMSFTPCRNSLKNRLAAYLRAKVYNMGFLERISMGNILKRMPLDFIGINYYSRQVVALKKLGPGNLAMDVCEKKHHRIAKNSLGWDIYPKGLYDVLLSLKKYNLPIMITENGICTDKDSQRWEYIHDHLRYICLAMKKGVKITGYLYWSLMDNFEWDKGFKPRFGIVDINYKTYKRTIRKSAKKFAEVCRTGVLR
ncbi:MAG: glycoside hydrolase family 1 protein [Candidatus Omnitrophica bacterium]|nr:glycoside hydrolase family 1 protein [Candidatus Omnitrophota bacterium]